MYTYRSFATFATPIRIINTRYTTAQHSIILFFLFSIARGGTERAHMPIQRRGCQCVRKWPIHAIALLAVGCASVSCVWMIREANVCCVCTFADFGFFDVADNKPIAVCEAVSTFFFSSHCFARWLPGRIWKRNIIYEKMHKGSKYVLNGNRNTQSIMATRWSSQHNGFITKNMRPGG